MLVKTQPPRVGSGRPVRRTSVERLGVTSVENLLCAALAMGFLVTSLRTDAFGDSSPYRTWGLCISGCLIAATFFWGIALRPDSQSPRVRNRDALVLLAGSYFAWCGIQSFFLQSSVLHAALSLMALLLVMGTLAADLQRMIAGLRRWFLVVVIACLMPAVVLQGFEPGRVWLDFLPGRYFAFSNPNALAFLAGLAVLLAVPVLRQGRGWVLALLGAVLAVLASGYTTAVALGLALLAYFGLGQVKNTGLPAVGVGALALATPMMLIWLPSESALRAVMALQSQFDLSGRSLLWVHLVRLTRDLDEFWTGLGDRAVAFYTEAILGVATAHSTILQMFLSKGFLTTVFFVFVAAAATIHILNAYFLNRSGNERVAFAVVVYWFVVSLASTQPGTALGFSLVVVLAVASTSAARVGLDPPVRAVSGEVAEREGAY
jgi:O-antigen ligase